MEDASGLEPGTSTPSDGTPAQAFPGMDLSLFLGDEEPGGETPVTPTPADGVIEDNPRDRWVTYVNDKGDEGAILLPDTLEVNGLLSIAADDRHVLISGETGTGKDELAKYLWYKSRRYAGAKGKPGPFKALNCAQFTDDLVASELFGHIEGAFSGAIKTRIGLLADLDGGTIVLEEIGTLSPHNQAKLLQFMHTGCVRPLGSNDHTTVDVRVIATTNAAIENAGTFRTDLLHRFGVRLRLPPLRSRKDDIPYLIGKFMEPYDACKGIYLVWLMKLMTHVWPGNIRELHGYCETIGREITYRPKLGMPVDASDSERACLTSIMGFHFLLDQEPIELKQEPNGGAPLVHVARYFLSLHEAAGSLERARNDPALANELKVLLSLAETDAFMDVHYDPIIPFTVLTSAPRNCSLTVPGYESGRCDLVRLLMRLLFFSRRSVHPVVDADAAYAQQIDTFKECASKARPSEEFCWAIADLNRDQRDQTPRQPAEQASPTSTPGRGRTLSMSDAQLAGHIRNIAESGLSWNDLIKRLIVKNVPVHQTRCAVARRVGRFKDPALRSQTRESLSKIRGFSS